MKKSRYTTEQVAFALRQAERGHRFLRSAATWRSAQRNYIFFPARGGDSYSYDDSITDKKPQVHGLEKERPPAIIKIV